MGQAKSLYVFMLVDFHTNLMVLWYKTSYFVVPFCIANEVTLWLVETPGANFKAKPAPAFSYLADA